MLIPRFDHVKAHQSSNQRSLQQFKRGLIRKVKAGGEYHGGDFPRNGQPRRVREDVDEYHVE